MNGLKICNKASDRLQAGINVYRNIGVKDVSALDDYIKNERAAILETHSRELPPGFSFSRKLYRAFSTDPTKYRPSSEALWRRTKKGLDFPMVNPFVDLTNLLSMRYQVPYGLYDLDKLEGEIEIGAGAPGDNYQGIRKDTINLEGKIALKDILGPFGNPSSDSLRTSTTSETTNLLQVIFFHAEAPLKEDILSGTYKDFLQFFEIADSDSFIV